MYAIIQSGGKQYKVAQGDVINVELMDAAQGAEVEIGNVLAVNGGEGLKIGKPFVEGATVKAKVLSHGKGPKLIIFKYKSKKDFNKKQGHRQPYTQLEIMSIEA